MKIAVNDMCTWEYVNPPPLNHKILMLTKDNICVIGVWKGEVLGKNKTYKGWQGLPGRDRSIEEKLGYR